MRGRMVAGETEPGTSGDSAAESFERANSERSLWRCWSVERRSEEERLGIVAKGLDAGDDVPVTDSRSSSLVESGVVDSPAVLAVFSLSNMLKSGVKLAA